MTTEDGGAPPRIRRAGVRDREEEVVAQLRRLSTTLDDEPAPGFRAVSRARLVAMAAVRPPEPASPGVVRRLLHARAGDRPPSRWVTRGTAGLTGAALAVGALGTLVALSAGAQPGDLLYDLKRGTEQTRLALAGEDRGLTLLQFASTRLDELAAASADPDLVVRTLATMDAQTTEGAALLVGSALESRQAATADRLADWSEDQSADLATLQRDLPTATTGMAQASLDLLGAVQARVAAVQAALDCPTVPAAAGTDELGPVPGLCLPEPPAAPAGGTPSAGGTPPDDPDTPVRNDPATSATPLPPAGSQPGGGTSGMPRGSTDAGPGPGSGAGPGSDPGPGPVPGGSPGDGVPSTGGGPAAPSVPLPVPLPAPVGGLPSLPSVPGVPGALPTTAGPPAPPLVDTPLQLCAWPLLC